MSDPGMIANDIGGSFAGPHEVLIDKSDGTVRSVTVTRCPDAVTACLAPSVNGMRSGTPGRRRSSISTIGTDMLVKCASESNTALSATAPSCLWFSTLPSTRSYLSVNSTSTASGDHCATMRT